MPSKFVRGTAALLRGGFATRGAREAPTTTPGDLGDAAPAAADPARPRRILVAEDNDVNQFVVRRLLESMGYADITIVADGEAALEACGTQQFDLILMDCQMPRLDGQAATAELRRRGVRTPVIALTATVSPEECLRAGMDDHMAKPVDAAALKRKLRRWMGAT